jgi:hypothetical protein
MVALCGFTENGVSETAGLTFEVALVLDVGLKGSLFPSGAGGFAIALLGFGNAGADDGFQMVFQRTLMVVELSKA